MPELIIAVRVAPGFPEIRLRILDTRGLFMWMLFAPVATASPGYEGRF
ncbi:MAG TPA: hypothetical protein VMW70_15670 [Burkholderiales bacterium]|nr:hypothetical protein [Burkholderiales bacterium]